MILQIVPQFLVYIAAGAVGTTAHYLVLVIFVEIFSANPVTASAGGFVIGAVINYILNHRFTFTSLRTHKKALPRFMIVALAGAALNIAVMDFLVNNEKAIHYLFAQVVATGLVVLITFFANRTWTFCEKYYVVH